MDSDDVTGTAPDSHPAKAFERCVAAVELLEAGDATSEDFDRLFADFSLIPRGWPKREALAERLAKSVMSGLALVVDEFQPRSMAMVDVFDASSGSSLVDRFGLMAMRINALLSSGPEDYDPGDSQTLEEYFRRHGMPDSELYSECFGFLVRCLLVDFASDASTPRSMYAEARSLLRQISTRQESPEINSLAMLMEYLADVLADVEQQQRSGSSMAPAAFAAQASRLLEVLDQFPVGKLRDGTINDSRRRFSMAFGQSDGGTAGSLADIEIVTDAMSFTRAEAAATRAQRSTAIASQDDDPVVLDRALRDVQYAIELSEAHGGPGPELLKAAAATYLLRGTNSGSRRDFETCIELCEQALDAKASHLRADSSELYLLLAAGYWRTDRFSDSVDAALRGLAGYAWLALIQNDAPDAHIVVRNAAHFAALSARACTRIEDAADAARILEAGRALIVFAAQQTGNVATRLGEIGNDALADEWNRAVASYGIDSLPPQLRLRAFCALAGVPVGPDGLSIPWNRGGSCQAARAA